MGWNQDPGTGTNLLRILDPDPQHCLTVLCVAARERRHPETEKDQEGESESERGGGGGSDPSGERN